MRLKFDYFLTCTISDCIWDITFKLTLYDGRLKDAIYAHSRFDDLDFDAKSQWVGKNNIFTLNALGS